MQPDTMIPAGIDETVVHALLDAAIQEDVGQGDLTSQAVIPAGMIFEGVMAARENMVCAGLPLAALVFAKFSSAIKWNALAIDGEKVIAGAELARVSGPAVDLLSAERTAINLLQHLSGIATLTRTYVEAINGTEAILLDTRKTIPGYRELAKYATRMGGATNHRMRLDDGVLIKDNHVAVAGGVPKAIQLAKQAGLKDVEVECDTLAQVEEALGAGADSILLDNMPAAMMSEAVNFIGGRVPTEASGDINLNTIRAAAEAGVTYISVGRLTHSSRAINIGLDWKTSA